MKDSKHSNKSNTINIIIAYVLLRIILFLPVNHVISLLPLLLFVHIIVIIYIYTHMYKIYTWIQLIIPHNYDPLTVF